MSILDLILGGLLVLFSGWLFAITVKASFSYRKQFNLKIFVHVGINLLGCIILALTGVYIAYTSGYVAKLL